MWQIVLEFKSELTETDYYIIHIRTEYVSPGHHMAVQR